MAKYILVAITLLVFLPLAWFAGTWLGLVAMDLLVLRIGLGIIGLSAATAVVFWLRKKDIVAGKSGDTALAPISKEIDALIRSAQGKVNSSRAIQRRGLAEFPVILLVGDTGSCKTSMVARSGLDAELLAGHVYDDNAIAPTRLLNLWFARNVVFVEGGGKVQSDPGAWHSIVRRIQPSRLRSLLRATEPPRAAVVCVSCDDLLQSGGDGHVALARSLRARLDAIGNTLGVMLPVYVLMTKADRISFFSEYTRHLTNDEANQVLGVTLPIQIGRQEGVYSEIASQQLNAAFDNLVMALCDRRPDLLAREQDFEKLSGIYEFPRELRKLRGPVVQFLVELSKPTHLGASPFLRGFYLSGVRPTFVSEPVRQAPRQMAPKVSRPVDATRFFNPGEASAASAAAVASPLSRKVPQWVFLSHFFTDVLLQDRVAMGASRASLKTAAFKRAVLVATSVACLLVTSAFLLSFVGNHRLATDLTDSAQAMASNQEPAGNDEPTLARLEALERFRSSMESLTVYRRTGAPLHMRWGLYAGDLLYSPASRIYFDRFRQLIFADAQAAMLGDLKRLPVAPGPNDEYGPTYEALKAYLITTSNHDKSSRAFLSPVLMRYWTSAKSVDPVRSALVQKQIDFYAEELREANPYSSDAEIPTMELARRYLSEFEAVERVYQARLAEAASKFRAINFNQQFAGSAQYLLAAKEVSGAYSKDGWLFMNDAIKGADRFGSGEEWVLGSQSVVLLDRRQMEQTLRQRYTNDFIGQWREFLKAATFVPYTGLKDAAQKLTTISGNQSPLLALFSTISQNTGVQAPEIQSAFQPVQSVVPPESVDRYIGEKNENYVMALVNLQAKLDKLVNSPGGANEAVEAQDAARQAKVAAKQVAQNFKIDSDAHLETVVQNLMEAPIINVETLVKNVGPNELNAKGKALCTQWRDLMARYPFNPPASREATRMEVNEMLQPMQGALWTFYDLNLKTQLIRQGTQFIPSPSASIHITPAFVTFFNRAAALSDALYANNAQQPRVPFRIRVRQGAGIENLTLSIDNQLLKSDGLFRDVVWQMGESSEVKLTGRFGVTDDRSYFASTGPWSLFKFFATAEKSTNQDAFDTFDFSWTVQFGRATGPVMPNENPVRLDVETGNAPRIFRRGFLSNVVCVSDIARP